MYVDFHNDCVGFHLTPIDAMIMYNSMHVDMRLESCGTSQNWTIFFQNLSMR